MLHWYCTDHNNLSDQTLLLHFEKLKWKFFIDKLLGDKNPDDLSLINKDLRTVCLFANREKGNNFVTSVPTFMGITLHNSRSCVHKDPRSLLNFIQYTYYSGLTFSNFFLFPSFDFVSRLRRFVDQHPDYCMKLKIGTSIFDYQVPSDHIKICIFAGIISRLHHRRKNTDIDIDPTLQFF